MSQKVQQDNVKIEITVHSAGYIKDYHGHFGFEVGEAQPINLPYYDERFFNVYMWEGRVYISSSLLTTLIGSTLYMQPNAKIGRKQLYRFDRPDIQEDIQHHYTYERRSDREREVAQRNEAIYWWLMDLATSPVS
jgi:hypothetical protein